MDPDVIIAKANRIAEPGSAESLAFRAELQSTPGVLSVGNIVNTQPAGKVVVTPTKAPEEDKDDDSSNGLVIGLVIGGIVILLLVTGGAMYLRGRKPAADAKEQPGPNILATSQDAKGESEANPLNEVVVSMPEESQEKPPPQLRTVESQPPAAAPVAEGCCLPVIEKFIPPAPNAQGQVLVLL